MFRMLKGSSLSSTNSSARMGAILFLVDRFSSVGFGKSDYLFNKLSFVFSVSIAIVPVFW